jgi:uncharacterized glyoxalase superfamily protein PhnB
MTATASRPRVKKLLPSLGVSDLQRSMLFYREVFGFEVVDSFEDEDGELLWCWLRAGVGELMLQQLDPDQQMTLDPAIGQSWCLYVRTDDILATQARLRAGGLDVSEIDVTAYGAKECFATDPDGYVLWLSEPEQGRGPDDEDDDEGDTPQLPMH